MKNAVRTPLVGVAMALLLLSGCNKVKEKLAQKAAEKASEATTGAEATVTGDGVTVRDSKTGATFATGNAKLPEGWPSNVPTYPGAKIQSSMGSPSGKTVILVTQDAPQKVVDFYKTKLSQMKKQTELDLGGSFTIVWAEGKRGVSIVVSHHDDETMVQVSVSDS